MAVALWVALSVSWEGYGTLGSILPAHSNDYFYGLDHRRLGGSTPTVGGGGVDEFFQPHFYKDSIFGAPSLLFALEFGDLSFGVISLHFPTKLQGQECVDYYFHVLLNIYVLSLNL